VLAIEITQQRSDGLFVIGWAEQTPCNRWVVFTLKHELLCDSADGYMVFFATAEDAAEALTDTSGYTLRAFQPRTP
jgi:hypothetical protein